MGFDHSQTVVLSTILRSPFLGLIIIWEIIWKATALWKAARHNQLYWFIGLVIINSVGILPIVYILFFQKDKNTQMAKKLK